MAVLRELHRFDPPSGGTVLTIGNFDGVHLGHHSLLDLARTFAAPQNRPIVALTFEPHPLAILRPDEAPPRLTTPAEKAALLRAAGADEVVILPADRELLGQTPADFVTNCVAPCLPRQIVEGPTFGFGRGRAGDNAVLAKLVEPLGCSVHVAPEARTADGLAINSTAVRDALREGDATLAGTMLGRPYRITGVVGRGAGRGTPLGFPTANLDAVPQLVPGFGVYAGVAQTAAGGLHLAAINVGPQPTFAGAESRIEAHLLDFAGDLRDQPIGVYFVRRLRGQQRFDGIDALREQLARDIEATRALRDPATLVSGECFLPLGVLP